MKSARWAGLVILLLLTACNQGPPPEVSIAVPSDSMAVAVVDLAALRSSHFLARLPQFAPLAQIPETVRQLALAWNGRELVQIASGSFAQAPQGFTSIGRRLAASGSAARIEAARQRAASTKSLPGLPEVQSDIRAILHGDGRLPLAGNLENVQRLLLMAKTTTLVAHVGNSVELEMAAQCESADAARQLEETLRAMKTLATSTARDSDLSAFLGDLQTTRESIVIRVRGVTRPEVLEKLLASRQ